MSGILKSVGKVFRAVVVKPIKFVLKMDHKVAMKIWHTPILRYIAIAVAIYFTAGAAAGYFGAAGAAGGTAAAGTAAGAAGAGGALGASTVGGSILAGGTYVGIGSTATYIGGTSFAAGAAAGAAGAVGAGAVAGAAGAGGGSVLTGAAYAGPGAIAAGGGTAGEASTIAYSSVGQAAGTQAAEHAAQLAGTSMAQGGGAITGTPGGLTSWGAPAGQAGSSGQGVLGGSTYTGPGSTASYIGSPTGESLAASGGAPVGSPALMEASQAGAAPAAETTQPGFLGRMGQGLKHIWSGTPGVAADGTPVVTGGMSSFEKIMLLKSAVDMASGWMANQPRTQPQFSGRGPGGGGAGMGIHSINGGFGLAAGGHEPSPSGVPDILRPPGSPTAGAYAGSLSDAALQSNGGGNPGNLGQTVANQAGVGGLVPQGAVDYMGNNRG